MGKTLVIKDADFSENHVDVSPIYYNGVFNMTGTNYRSILNKAPRMNGDWTAYNASYKTRSYPIDKGSVVTLRRIQPSGSNLYDIVLATAEGGYEEAIAYMTGKNLIQLRNSLFVSSFLAPEDGFFMVEYSESSAPFPDIALVRPYDMVDRVITEDTADYGNAYYLKADGTYASANPPEGKNGCSFFSVFKGEVIDIVARDNEDTVYCLMSAVPSSANANPSILTGQSRQTLSAGSSVQLEIPEDCLLYLWTYDVNTNHFPKSVSVTRVEL